MLAALYSNVLVENDANPVPQIEWNALGGNRKNILVVVSHEGVQHLPDGELQFLITILKACQLTLADVAIINLDTSTEKNYKTITGSFGTQHILLFKVTPLQFGLPVHFPFFQIQRFDQCTYLSAPALQEIEKDTESKKQLWSSLKTMFSLGGL